MLQLHSRTNLIMETKLELAPKLNQAARMKSLGFSNKEICDKLGISDSHLSIQSKSPLFLSVVKELREELDEATKVAQKILIESAPQAAEKLVNMLESTEHQGLKRLLALDILRGSGAIKNESSTPQINITLSETKMNVILETINQIKVSGGNGAIKEIE